MGTSYQRLASAAVLAVIGVLAAAAPVVGDPASPDTFTIHSVKAFHNLYETGDALYTFHYEIYYPLGEPSTPANKLFLFRLMDTDGATQLGSTVPYPYNNSGYDMGVGGFYFAAADAPTWETGLIVRMEGNPMYWGSPPVYTHTFVLSEYSQMTTPAENKVLLGNWILDTAVDLEVNWGIKLITEGASGTVLTTTGETYFKGTISGLKEMCPQIFSIAYSSHTLVDDPVGTSAIYEWEHQWDGTWVADAFQSLGDLFGLHWRVVSAVIVGAVTVVLAAFSQIKWGTTDPGFFTGAIAFAGFCVAGFVDWAPLGAGALICVLYVSYILLWRNG